AEHTVGGRLVPGGGGAPIKLTIHHTHQNTPIEVSERADIDVRWSEEKVGGQRIGVERIFLHRRNIQPYAIVAGDDPVTQGQVAGGLVMHVEQLKRVVRKPFPMDRFVQPGLYRAIGLDERKAGNTVFDAEHGGAPYEFRGTLYFEIVEIPHAVGFIVYGKPRGIAVCLEAE